MRLLLIHADALEFEVKKPALKGIAELPADQRKGAAAETLVVFYSVEKPDEADPAGVVKAAVASIQDVAGQVKAAHVTLYPYAHLSSELAPPRAAQQIGADLFAATQAAGFQVLNVPFGHYKAFTIKAKGHPLAELSRTVRAGDAAASPKGGPAQAGKESEALRAEKKLVSQWFVLTPQGELVPAKDFDFSPWPELQRLYRYESAKVRAAAQEPPHVRMMQELELVDYEPGSDSGNFRWYPKGSLVKRLLETHVSDIVQRYGGLRVETPIMYDFQHPALNKYLQRFPARQYTVQSDDKEFFLRFAACFGQYLIAHDATISYRHLPLRLYELTHYSFRREQSGEVAGLKRLRAFTMPDMHTIVADMPQAKEEFAQQFELCMGWMADVGLPYEAAIRFVRSFYEENKDFAASLARKLGRPMLLEMWDERFFYFVMKFEFNVIDSQDKASALSTVQIDVENTERFDITYADHTGQKKLPYLLHASISGSVDRNVYALLETQAREVAKGKKAMLPFWIAPTQVRICPVNDTFVPQAEALVAQLAPFRVDVDDREEGIGRKVRDAEKEWVPVIIVVGEKEAASGKLAARLRWSGEQQELAVPHLLDVMRQQQGARPQAALPLPVKLTRRPVFRG
ncbi:MAG TPA: threonine--tRNA ligase [Candidatus Thermoplasmatota archaeon]|nr:threonine--tRNA ligase [Candidatus Thermoplasmatota archaeon]